MDITLLQKAPKVVALVAEAVLFYGANDVMRDPFYCVQGFNRENELKEEITAVIDFACEWDIDPKEWNFETKESREMFCISYLASCFPFDDEDDGKEYTAGILEQLTEK